MSALSSCDGAGACVAGTPKTCAGYGCDGAACRTSCTSDAHCVDARRATGRAARHVLVSLPMVRLAHIGLAAFLGLALCDCGSSDRTRPTSLSASAYIRGSIDAWSVGADCSISCSVSPVTAPASMKQSGAATLDAASCGALLDAFAEEVLRANPERPPAEANCADASGPPIEATYPDGTRATVRPYGCAPTEPYATMLAASRRALSVCYAH